MPMNERQYASIENPSICAIVTGSYSFVDRAKAIERLELTHAHFVTAKKTHKAPDGGPGFLMWVKGFAVTPEEAGQGIIGNFAHIYCDKNEKGRHTLVAQKMAMDIKQHPMRQRPTHSHPDWGHPILRGIKKRKPFKTLEDAQEELNLLHETFPNATIPNPGKLHIMVYERGDNKASPMQKYVFEIQAEQGVGYLIDYKKKTMQAAPKPATPSTAATPQGYFTQKEKVRRAKKRKRVLPHIEKKDPA